MPALLTPEEFDALQRRVAGAEFSAASVAAGLATDDIDAVEQSCEALARRAQFLQPKGKSNWPDGTIAARYGFIHALY
ncbi:MAG: hypothetical protein AB7G75_37470, partial [Candidatus Binatia bacterium]